MGRQQRTLCALMAALAALCALATRAFASSTQETILMDDDHLIYQSEDKVVKTLEQIHALGVDRVKVSLVWSIVAPRSSSTHKPKFNAADPGAYPANAWDRYDLIARVAPALGMQVYFELNPPAPAWATPKKHPSQGYRWSQTPNTSEYEKFVEAAGTRYSGSYAPGAGKTNAPAGGVGLPISVPGVTSTISSSDPPAIPRVNFWGIWNEPNEAAWLNPQWDHVSGSLTILKAPMLYRGIVNAAWTALGRTGHRNDTILIGETASRGWILPTAFIDALYCVSPRTLRPLTGTAARNASCPTSGNRRQFVSSNPGLFFMAGYAHHPYSFDVAPSGKPQFPGEITLSRLGGFDSVLSRILGGYGHGRRGGVPMYLTEWGYKTNPPNPYVHTSQREQAIWLNQGEYMTYRLPWVKSLTQFLLVDDQPNTSFKPGSRLYWSTPDTGLLNLNWSPKPAYGAFRIPIWIPAPRHGRHVTVWGQLRPADHSQPQQGVLYYQRRGGKWTALRTIATSNSRGFLLVHVAIRGKGKVRLGWRSPGGKVYYSRVVSIS